MMRTAPRHRNRTDYSQRRLRLERLENRLALAGFGPDDGAYFIEARSGSYESVAVQTADQKIVAADSNSTIARYEAQGAVDSNYGSGGIATVQGLNSWARGVGNKMGLQSDGSALLAGSIGGFFSTNESLAVSRVIASGTVDSSFGTGGMASVDLQTPRVDEVAFAVARQSTGKIIAAGFSGPSFAVARFTAGGALDTGTGGFGQGARGYSLMDLGGYNLAGSSTFYDLAIQSDDKVVAVGLMDTTGGFTYQLVVARYTADGILDTTFNSSGYSVFLPAGFSHSEGEAVTIQADGKIVVAGYATGIDGFSDMLVARYNTDGTLDTSFGGVGYLRLDADGTTNQTGDYAYAVTIQPDGKIVIAGWETQTFAGAPGNAVIARMNTNGTLDASFGTGGYKIVAAPANRRLQANAVTLQADGSIIVAGTQDVSSGSADPHPLLMRFFGGAGSNAVNDPPTGTDKSFSVGARHIFTNADFGFADSADVPPNNLKAVVFTQLPSAGNLLFGGAPVVQGQSYAVAGISQGKLRYLAPALLGPVTMQFKVQDDGGTANGGVDTALSPNTITFNVVTNSAPVASNLTRATNKDTPVNVNLAATDAENDGLAYTVVTPPQHGMLTGIAPNLTYTPANNFKGADSFTFKSNDGKADSNSATVTINVIAVTVIAENGKQTIPGFAQQLFPDFPAGGLPNARFRVTNNNNPLFAVQPTIDSTGTLTFTPAPNSQGKATITVVKTTTFASIFEGEADEPASAQFEITIVQQWPWQNDKDPDDVNDDKNVVADDVLLVIDYINANGSGDISNGGSQGPFYDSDGDNYICAADVLEIINTINAQNNAEEEAPSELTTTIAAGPLTQLSSADLLNFLAYDVATQQKRRVG